MSVILPYIKIIFPTGVYIFRKERWLFFKEKSGVNLLNVSFEKICIFDRNVIFPLEMIIYVTDQILVQPSNL